MNTRLIVWSFALLSLFSACAEEGSPSDDSIGVNGENLSNGRGKGDKDKKPKPPQAGAPCAGSGGSAGSAGKAGAGGTGGKGGAGGAGGSVGSAGTGGSAGAAGGGAGNCDYTKNLFSQMPIFTYLGVNSSLYWGAQYFNFVDADTTKYLVPCQQREKDYAAQGRASEFDMGFCLLEAVAYPQYVDTCVAKTTNASMPDVRYGYSLLTVTPPTAADKCEVQQLCDLQVLENCAKGLGLLECGGLREITPTEQSRLWECIVASKKVDLVNASCPTGFSRGGVCL